jgi:hypothetical protein
MKQARALTNRNVVLAKQRWGRLTPAALTALRELSREYRLSVALGDLLFLDQRWYVSHAGLLVNPAMIVRKISSLCVLNVIHCCIS